MKIHRVLLATAASALAAIPAWATNPTATATYTDTMISPGEFQYNITLNNTGSVPIGVFWFSWVPGAGFLSPAPDPTKVMSPSGWTPNPTNNGAAIMWMTSSSWLAAGGKLTGFSFDSTETPNQLAGKFMGMGTGSGDWITTSYVYTQLPPARTSRTLPPTEPSLLPPPRPPLGRFPSRRRLACSASASPECSSRGAG